MAARRRRAQVDEEDEGLEGLTRVQLLNIHAAYDRFSSRDPDGPPPAKRRAVETEPADGGGFMAADEDAPGGFMVDDESAAGGFMVDDDAAGPSQAGEGGFQMPSFAREASDDDDEGGGDLPFARIVPALRSLHLPHDSEILDTFRAAADGDEGPDEETADDGLTVSRENFMRVVAVLFANEADPSSDDEQEAYRDEHADTAGSTASARHTRSKGRAAAIEIADSDDEQPQVIVSAAASEPTPASGKGRGRKRAITTGELSTSKKAIVKQVFDHFQPMKTSKGPAISYDGIRAVAKVLQQSLTDTEIGEMLEYASTTGGSFVTLDAFEDVMRSARAV